MMMFDVEMYENDYSVIFEIGFVVGFLVRLEDDEKVFYFIIRENSYFVNKDYVFDNREKFSFGILECMFFKEVVGRFLQYIKDVDFLVIYLGVYDEVYFVSFGILLEGKFMFDIQFFVLVLLISGMVVFGFKCLLSDLVILFDENIFYNGGNDVVYIMKVFCVFVKKI